MARRWDARRPSFFYMPLINLGGESNFFVEIVGGLVCSWRYLLRGQGLLGVAEIRSLITSKVAFGITFLATNSPLRR